MSENITVLNVAARQVTGKQVNQLRMQGIIPGVVYGPSQKEPLAFQVEWTALRPLLKKVGSTEILEIHVDGKAIPTLIREVQRDPVRNTVLHLDLYAVDMNATTRTAVPVTVHGLEAASKRLATRVYQVLTIVEVESLPTQIPQHVEVDLNKLTRAGEHLSVRDLPVIEGVKYLTDEDTIVVQAATLGSDVEEDLDGEVVMGEVEVIGRGKDKDEEEDF